MTTPNVPPPATTSTVVGTSAESSPQRPPTDVRETRTSKTYGTGKAMRGLSPVPLSSETPARAVPTSPVRDTFASRAAPSANAGASLTPALGAAPSAPAEDHSPPAPSLVEEVAKPEGTAPDGAAPAPAEGEPPPAPIDDVELAKRVATIARGEAKLAEKQRAHSHQMAIADAVESYLGKENASPANLRQVFQHLNMVQQGRQLAAQDPIGYLARVFGIDPRITVQKAIDLSIADGAKKPEDRIRESQSALEQRIAQFEQQQREALDRQQRDAQTRQVEDYQRTTIAPVLADGDKFSHTVHFCRMQGADPVKELYAAMVERYRKTGVAPEPLALATEIENNLRKQYALPASNAKNGEKASPPRSNGAPQAAPAPGREQAANGETSVLKRQRMNAKPYSTKRM